jgi:hypothetical protein
MIGLWNQGRLKLLDKVDVVRSQRRKCDERSGLTGM